MTRYGFLMLGASALLCACGAQSNNGVGGAGGGTAVSSSSSGGCPAVPHVMVTQYDGGVCVWESCQPGWSNCDGNHENGCETSGACDAGTDGAP